MHGKYHQGTGDVYIFIKRVPEHEQMHGTKFNMMEGQQRDSTTVPGTSERRCHFKG